MFVRKKKNKSGVISVQVIDKSTGKYKVKKTIGSSSNPEEIDLLVIKGKEWIKSYLKQQELDFSTKLTSDEIFESITNIHNAGIELTLGLIYKQIGFNFVDEEILYYLTLTKLSFPASKLKTTDYLRRYFGKDINEDRIYRYLDQLYNNQKERIQQISYKHTLKILGGMISVVFYDVTTLYFQIDDEDEIRKRGFSKEGKHQNPQILLGLLVSIDGYPLAFDIFEGNKFEGHTMLPVLDAFKTKYQLDKLVIIADSGLMSLQNITELQEKGYEFILGARIKNEKQKIKDKILSLELKNGESEILEKQGNLKLIISYSDKRSKKDKHNRERGLKRLEKQLRSGKLTKSNINNRGYNKYLKMEGDITISIDKEKYELDSKWDGLKGYITNTSLSKNEIIENYGHLWKIEKAFRISKHDLKLRPIYHRLQKRIEAHITINFVAYKVYKELERQLKEKNANISVEKLIDIAKTIYTVTIKDPSTKQLKMKTLLLNEEQIYVAELFN
ncbi:MAG TPA: IS1634 family transposase, partial [Campylobacterales bacterium]|nr:IS1634 family transposase [Campylobacterales bacterium]